MDLFKVLSRCEVFVGLDDAALLKVATLAWRRGRYSIGDFIFHEEALADHFYVLEEGAIDLTVTLGRAGAREAVQVCVDTLAKGDVFGWSSIIPPHFLTMSAVCVKPSLVAAVRGSELLELMDSNPFLGYEVAKGLLRVLGRRLRDFHKRVARIQ